MFRLTNLLIRKLEAFASLTEADRQVLNETTREVRDVGPRQDLIQEGDVPSDVYLILEGFACRYKLLGSGKRHIVAFLVPGDFCDLHVFILKAMDHSITTLSRCKVVKVSRRRILEWTERPAILRALWWATLVDEATLREWLVNIGARSAEERIAHLLCELMVRLRTVGLAHDGRYELPLTQAEIADAMGLSDVHVNRVLQRLRTDGMITLSGKALVILDIGKLQALGGFNPNYLHLEAQDGAKGQRV